MRVTVSTGGLPDGLPKEDKTPEFEFLFFGFWLNEGCEIVSPGWSADLRHGALQNCPRYHAVLEAGAPLHGVLPKFSSANISELVGQAYATRQFIYGEITTR